MDVESISESTDSCSETCSHTFSDGILDSNFENNNTKLEKRLSNLKDMMEDLRSELSNEKELWKKEVEEVAKLSNQSSEEQICTCNCEDEDYSSSSQSYNAEPTLNDMSILDYEQKLSVYQQALSKAHAEKRMHLRRHLAANAYKQRLLELENMCNVELLRVKQNVQSLQPLQAIVSEWDFQIQENTCNLDDEITGGKSIKTDFESNRESVIALENFGNKINTEIKELASRISPAHSSLGTTSSLIPEEDDDALMMRRLQSLGWYWYNDKNNYPFNPLM